MNWKPVIVMVLAGAAGYGGYRLYKYFKAQSQDLQNYQVDLIGIRLTSVADGLLTGEVDIRIRNTSDVEATVKEVFTTVDINGIYVGNVKSSGEFVIPAKGSSDIKLKFAFASKELLKNVINTILSLLSTKDIGYKLEGYAKIQSSFIGVQIPFKYSGLIKEDLLSSN